MPNKLSDQAIAKRDNLYWNYRYAIGSYKARKAAIHPVLMMAKRDGSMLRLYDDGTHQPTKVQEAMATARFKAWRQKERELRQQAKLAAKKSGQGRRKQRTTIEN